MAFFKVKSKENKLKIILLANRLKTGINCLVDHKI